MAAKRRVKFPQGERKRAAAGARQDAGRVSRSSSRSLRMYIFLPIRFPQVNHLSPALKGGRVGLSGPNLGFQILSRFCNCCSSGTVDEKPARRPWPRLTRDVGRIVLAESNSVRMLYRS